MPPVDPYPRLADTPRRAPAAPTVSFAARTTRTLQILWKMCNGACNARATKVRQELARPQDAGPVLSGNCAPEREPAIAHVNCAADPLQARRHRQATGPRAIGSLCMAVTLVHRFTRDPRDRSAQQRAQRRVEAAAERGRIASARDLSHRRAPRARSDTGSCHRPRSMRQDRARSADRTSPLRRKSCRQSRCGRAAGSRRPRGPACARRRSHAALRLARPAACGHACGPCLAAAAVAPRAARRERSLPAVASTTVSRPDAQTNRRTGRAARQSNGAPPGGPRSPASVSRARIRSRVVTSGSARSARQRARTPIDRDHERQQRTP